MQGLGLTSTRLSSKLVFKEVVTILLGNIGEKPLLILLVDSIWSVLGSLE